MENKNWDFPKNGFALEIRNLNKIYDKDKNNYALKDVSLSIPAGSIFGLLGPNGAGKSTLINIISGVVTKTSGDVSIWGYDIDRNRKQSKIAIGVVPQELNIDAFFTPRETLDLHSGMFNVPKSSYLSNYLLELMDLTDKANSYSRKLSGGMRRRLLVAKAMVHSPPIIILDEPTAGVDIQLRQKLWQNFFNLNKIGVTLILTTHYLEEAEFLCDHIAIINNGKIIANETKDDLLSKFSEKIIKIKLKFNNISKEDMLSLQKLGKIKMSNKEILINYNPDKTSIRSIIEVLHNTNLDIIDLTTKEIRLEDVFINLTSKL